MSQNTIRVRYIGLKPKCTDSFPSGTIHTWTGPDDIQLLPASALPKLLKHPTVWEILVPDEAPEGLGLAAAESKAETTEETPSAEVLAAEVIDTMDLPALKAYAKAHSIKVDGRLRDVDAIRAVIKGAQT